MRRYEIRSATGGRRGVRRGVLAAGLSAVVVAAVACGGGGEGNGGEGGGKVTLTFTNWAAAEQTTRPGMLKTIKAFEKSHPNINIKSEAVSFSEIGHQLVLRTQSGNPPDVAEIAGNDTFTVAATGALEPLDSHLGSDLKSSLSKGALQTKRFKGELIAMPWTVSPVGFWYNKKILDKAGIDGPPATIDEFLADMAKIHKSQPKVIPFGIDTTNRSFAFGVDWPWMKAFGAEPIGKSGPAADTEQMKAFLSFMRKVGQNDYIQPNRKIGDFRPLAAHGKVAFVWDQDLFQGNVQSANGMSDKEFYDTWGVTTQPVGPAGEPYTVLEGHQLIIFGDSEHKDAAWKFVKYLATNPDAVENYTIGVENSLPPFSEAPNDKIAGMLDAPTTNTFRDKVIPTAIRPPYGQNFAKASTPIMAGVQQAITSKKSIDSIASSMQKQLESAIG